MSDFDGVYLVPRDGVSSLSSRSDVNLMTKDGIFPIISSPMAGVSGKELVIEMGRNNYLGLYHRFHSLDRRLADIADISKSGVRFGVAIGIEDTEKELFVAIEAVHKYQASMICVDIANGYLEKLMKYGSILRNMFPHLDLMAGNVVTLQGGLHLNKAGFNFVRVGIGGGSHCLTRNITGVGRNQLQAINHTSGTGRFSVVADGGIRNSGDAMKCFAAGADFVMLGGMLAYAHEADNDGLLYGMASARNHELRDKKVKSVEGRESSIDNDEKKPLKDILENFMWGIKSGCTYLNAASHLEVRDKCVIEKDEFSM